VSIIDLVQGFSMHVKALKAPETKEASIRQTFIDPFWRALGWDVGDEAQRGPAEAEVIVENNVETAETTGLHTRAVDYLFRLNGFPRFVVEAKKPAIDIDSDMEAIFQAKRYAWNKTIPFAILTDFEQFRLYDTTLKPIFNDPGRGLVSELSLDYGSYVAQWDVLVSTFGRAAVAGGSLERLLAKVKKIKPGRRIRTVDRMLIDLKGGEPVDQAFLALLDSHRGHFAAEIYKHNKSVFPDADTLHGAAKLTEAVQRLMDRLVFMRVCEDRGIVTWGALREILHRVGSEGGDFYTALLAEFREWDRDYNGYLFKPWPLEEITVDGNVLADFIRDLYPPDGPWDFNAIGDDILGTVYERFLGNTIEVKGGRVAIEAKPEYKDLAKKTRHKTGVFYTPRFVVDTIIRRVVGPKIAGKTPAELLEVKILDLGCGSGTFLVAALQYLFDYCLATVRADPSVAKAVIPALSAGSGAKRRKKKAQIAFKDRRGRWYLAPDFRAALLTHCIYGVDIDQQAVEVTVMSLYLKMLESKLPENWQHDWIENRLLPSLDNNIRCGNSLIDEDSYLRFREKTNRTQRDLFAPEDADTKFRINRFDWISRTHGFGRILDEEAVIMRGRGGFDCIVGNPPYVRVQEMNKWAPEECEFYKWRYKSAAKGNYDIYVVFTEKAISLLAPGGLMGFIMPHKFWQAKYGEGLRNVIADGKHLQAVVDFGDQQVFKGATTYTAIHILSHEAGKDFVDYAKVLELEDGNVQCANLDAGKGTIGTERFKSRRPEGAGPWVFTTAPGSAWLDAVKGNHPTLGEVVHKIGQGLVTSDDKVFFLTKCGREYRCDADEQLYELERAVVHPVLKGSVHMKRWLPLDSDRVVLFPYEENKGVWRLIPAAKFKTDYPKAWTYLNKHRKRLEARESGKMEGKIGWYGYIYPKNLDMMSRPKILVPAIATQAEYCLDLKGEYHYVGSGGGGGGGYAIVSDTSDLRYLCGLLNSTLLDAYLQRVTTPFHSGWFAYSKAYITQIPIKLPMTADERSLSELISISVRAIMDAKAKLRAPKLSDRETQSLAGEVEAHENRINKAVLALYGVDGLPE
jgi:SAM-dependent methyltransferase